MHLLSFKEHVTSKWQLASTEMSGIQFVGKKTAMKAEQSSSCAVWDQADCKKNTCYQIKCIIGIWSRLKMKKIVQWCKNSISDDLTCTISEQTSTKS